MILYLMRHAEAEKVGGEIQTDADRPLTPYGRMQAQAIAAVLQRKTVQPTVVTSPLRRAVETGEILCASLGQSSRPPEPLLTSTGHAPNLELLLKAYPESEHLLLIGHQPDIGMLVEKIMGFEFGFGTATIVAFESRPPAPWRFLWTHRPEELMSPDPKS